MHAGGGSFLITVGFVGNSVTKSPTSTTDTTSPRHVHRLYISYYLLPISCSPLRLPQSLIMAIGVRMVYTSPAAAHGENFATVPSIENWTEVELLSFIQS